MRQNICAAKLPEQITIPTLRRISYNAGDGSYDLLERRSVNSEWRVVASGLDCDEALEKYNG